jgi:HSP20 family protein
MNNTCNSTKFLRPAATLIERPDGFMVEADMPGVAKEGVTLTLEDDTLTILGKRGVTPAGARALHRESTSLDFRRAFELGRQIDRSRVSARLEQGVLQVFLPKAEELKPRRIEIAG